MWSEAGWGEPTVSAGEAHWTDGHGEQLDLWRVMYVVLILLDLGVCASVCVCVRTVCVCACASVHVCGGRGYERERETDSVYIDMCIVEPAVPTFVCDVELLSAELYEMFYFGCPRCRVTPTCSQCTVCVWLLFGLREAWSFDSFGKSFALPSLAAVIVVEISCIFHETLKHNCQLKERWKWCCINLFQDLGGGRGGVCYNLFLFWCLSQTTCQLCFTWNTVLFLSKRKVVFNKIVYY